MMGIYEIVNLADGKASSYVGSSADIKRRWGDHKYRLRSGQHENERLQRAWDKYGEDAFAFSVLEEVGEDMLQAMEQEYLDDYFGRGHCYNIKIEAGSGGPVSDETRCKLSEAQKGRRHTEAARHKMSVAHKGMTYPEEARRNMSKAHQGKKRQPFTEEHKRKLSEALEGRKGRPMSEENKRKLREANLGKKHSKERLL